MIIKLLLGLFMLAQHCTARCEVCIIPAYCIYMNGRSEIEPHYSTLKDLYSRTHLIRTPIIRKHMYFERISWSLQIFPLNPYVNYVYIRESFIPAKNVDFRLAKVNSTKKACTSRIGHKYIRIPFLGFKLANRHIQGFR